MKKTPINKDENVRQVSKDSPHWVKIVEYLQQFNPDHHEYVAPMELTQIGISEAVGISRAHACLILNDLIERGLIESKLVYVKGASRRRLAYFVSTIGVVMWL